MKNFIIRWVGNLLAFGIVSSIVAGVVYVLSAVISMGFAVARLTVVQSYVVGIVYTVVRAFVI